MLGIQLLGLIFGLFMIYFTFLHFKRKQFGVLELTVWIILWGGLLFVTLFPNGLDFLVKRVLSLKRPLDFFIICGFLFLTFLSFYNYTLTKKTALKVEAVVSRIALDQAERDELRKEHHREHS